MRSEFEILHSLKESVGSMGQNSPSYYETKALLEVLFDIRRHLETLALNSVNPNVETKTTKTK